jgi:hypothetical protein
LISTCWVSRGIGKNSFRMHHHPRLLICVVITYSSGTGSQMVGPVLSGTSEPMWRLFQPPLVPGLYRATSPSRSKRLLNCVNAGSPTTSVGRGRCGTSMLVPANGGAPIPNGRANVVAVAPPKARRARMARRVD